MAGLAGKSPILGENKMTEIIPGYFIHTPDEKFGPYANIMEADTAAEKLMSEGVQVLGITKEGFEGVVSFEALEYSAESFSAESYDHVATMRELVAWLNENNLEPSDIERFTPDGEVILKPLIQRAKYKEQQKKKDKDRIAKIKAWKKKNNYGPSQTIPRPVRQRMLKELSAEDGSYRDFLSGVDVPHSVTLAWANGADDWEELVYALGSELDEVSAQLQRVLIANEAFYDAHFD
jgi:hypothetical protein